METVLAYFILIIGVLAVFKIISAFMRKYTPRKNNTSHKVVRESAPKQKKKYSFTEMLKIDCAAAKKQNKEYFVYKYTFGNGKVYIGRTSTKRDRYGNSDEYVGQKVHEAMETYPNFKKEIVYRSVSLLAVAKKEHQLIIQNYKNSYNVAKEYNYKQHVYEELANKYQK